MTRWLLDTNVVSEPFRPAPSVAVGAWFGANRAEDMFIASMTLAEVRRGVLGAPDGARRRRLNAWFEGPDGPQALFAGRILPFDEAAALHWARLMADGARAGKPRSPLDMIIAAVAHAHGCVVVTGNDRHFRGIVPVINPARGATLPG